MLEEFVHLPMQLDVFLIEFPLFPSGVLWNESRFDVLVELIQQDVGKNGTHD